MNNYLQKYRFEDRFITSPPKSDLGIIVVIPCYNEEDLLSSLKSLNNCHRPKCSVEVICVINAGVNSDLEVKQQNNKTNAQVQDWVEKQKTDIDFWVYLNNELPKKHAGVGLARKIGMDEAVDRFDQINNDQGVIVCFDADSKCDLNYLVEIEKAFGDSPKATGASIHYEHPLEGEGFTDEVFEGITSYELFLRFYRQALKYAEHPMAFHTIGSSMAVRSSAYQKQSGMNKRKAGEDFYFLQKIIQLGNFIEINTTRVIPSPRTSDRVPFGTGKAISDHLAGKDLAQGYDLRSIEDLKQFISAVFVEYREDRRFKEVFFEKLPDSIQAFLAESDWDSRVDDLLTYGTNETTFTKRFYNWFNAFRVLKYVHFARDNFYPNQNLLELCKDLLERLDYKKQIPKNEREALHIFRELDIISG